MSEPTPRPWKAVATGQIEWSITGDDRALPLATGMYQEDAEHIVRCVNNMDDVMNLLQDMSQAIDDFPMAPAGSLRGYVNAALARARGTES